MPKHKRNTFSQKVVRQLTSVLPVAKGRKGKCVRCGNCCKLPYKCPLLGYDQDGNACCTIYRLRFWSCSKYPRTRHELLTADTCGFTFD